MKKTLYIFILLSAFISSCTCVPANQQFTDIDAALNRLNKDELSFLLSLNEFDGGTWTSYSFFIENTNGETNKQYYSYSTRELNFLKSVSRCGFVQGYDTLQRIIDKYGDEPGLNSDLDRKLKDNPDLDNVLIKNENSSYSLTPKGRAAIKRSITILHNALNN